MKQREFKWMPTVAKTSHRRLSCIDAGKAGTHRITQPFDGGGGGNDDDDQDGYEIFI